MAFSLMLWVSVLEVLAAFAMIFGSRERLRMTPMSSFFKERGAAAALPATRAVSARGYVSMFWFGGAVVLVFAWQVAVCCEPRMEVLFCEKVMRTNR